MPDWLSSSSSSPAKPRYGHQLTQEGGDSKDARVRHVPPPSPLVRLLFPGGHSASSRRRPPHIGRRLRRRRRSTPTPARRVFPSARVGRGGGTEPPLGRPLRFSPPSCPPSVGTPPPPCRVRDWVQERSFLTHPQPAAASHPTASVAQRPRHGDALPGGAHVATSGAGAPPPIFSESHSVGGGPHHHYGCRHSRCTAPLAAPPRSPPAAHHRWCRPCTPLPPPRTPTWSANDHGWRQARMKPH